jgi:hypothetical protein
MRTLRKFFEKLIASWLQGVVDLETSEPCLWPKAFSQSTPVRFTVLTPALQRALDRSA